MYCETEGAWLSAYRRGSISNLQGGWVIPHSKAPLTSSSLPSISPSFNCTTSTLRHLNHHHQSKNVEEAPSVQSGSGFWAAAHDSSHESCTISARQLPQLSERRATHRVWMARRSQQARSMDHGARCTTRRWRRRGGNKSGSSLNINSSDNNNSRRLNARMTWVRKTLSSRA
jgi:hypothetical protein